MDDKYTAVYLSDAIEHITIWLCEEELRKNIHPNRKLNQFLATDMLAKCPRIAEPIEPQTEVDCDGCKHNGEYNYCHYCENRHGDDWYEPKDEPQTERRDE